jgi:hypothetical protein
MRVRWAASVLALTVAVTPGVGAFQGQKKGPAKGQKGDAPAQAPGAPLTFHDLEKAIGAIYEARLVDLIRQRGLAAPLSAGELEKLKAAGASAAVIEAIRARTPAASPTPAAPAPAPAGPLALSCAPAECEILINGKSRGKTASGVLEVRGLPVGEVVVDFRREDYMSEQVIVGLKAGLAASKRVTLHPSPAALMKLGEQLFQKAVARLGGDTMFADQGTLTAAGEASLWQPGGQKSDWQVKAHLKAPSRMAYLEIVSQRQRWWSSLKDDNLKQDGSGQLRAGTLPAEMDKLIRLFYSYQPAMLLAEIRESKMKLQASDLQPDTNGNFVLKAASDTRSYELTLKPEGTISKVVFTPATGLGSGIDVMYSDHIPAGRGTYPKLMAIRFVEGTPHGIEFRFDSVNFQPKLADRDFRR